MISLLPGIGMNPIIARLCIINYESRMFSKCVKNTHPRIALRSIGLHHYVSWNLKNLLPIIRNRHSPIK